MRVHIRTMNSSGGEMPSAREIMTPGAVCVSERETLADAAQKMADLDIGSLPICGEDNRLKGVVTDRDIVVKAIAKGRNPADVPAGDLAEGKPVTIGADDDAAEILRTMGRYQVRRLPVIDGHELIGMVALADVARALPDRPVGDLVDAISKS
ncbi:CBS domain-containing protein [Actinoplanes ianthinogenes]|nr:CBS domain-containing protein [Actinoplanes ianthinogenes]